jgi:hypothetical protein
MLLLTEVASQGIGLDLRDVTRLVTEECRPVLQDGQRCRSLGQDDEGVRLWVKVVDHDVGGWGVRDREKTGLIGQGSYLLFAKE